MSGIKNIFGWYKTASLVSINITYLYDKESKIYVSIYVASQAIVNKGNLSITEYLKYFKDVMVCVRY